MCTSELSVRTVGAKHVTSRIPQRDVSQQRRISGRESGSKECTWVELAFRWTLAARYNARINCEALNQSSMYATNIEAVEAASDRDDEQTLPAHLTPLVIVCSVSIAYGG